VEKQPKVSGAQATRNEEPDVCVESLVLPGSPIRPKVALANQLPQIIMSETATSALRCVVVTPEETVIDIAADFIALPLFDGEIGIGLHHSPLIGRLGYGELRIRRGADTTHHYIDGGFVQVADNQISVLTNRAILAEEVDAEVAAELLSSALGRKASGEDQLAIRQRSQAQARAQLRMARRPK